jgi:hypothetical protein
MPRTTPAPLRPSGKGKSPSGVKAARKAGINTSNKTAAALIDPEKPLTDMQREFIKHWAAGESIVTAAFRAGYQDGGSYGYRMAAMPNVLKVYQEEKRLYEEAAGMSRKKVMDMLLESYEHAKYLDEPASMVAAAREVGRLCGYYEPVKHRVDVNHTGTVMHKRMSAMSDGELLELITNGKALDLVERAPDA